MRINPISMTYNRQSLKSQNNRQQNINFGTFQDKKTDRLTYDLLDVEGDDTGSARETYEYFKNTLFATIKSAKMKSGEDIVYAVMNKKATNKHENKARFDEVAKYYAKQKNDRFNKPAREAGIIDKEPNYLTWIEDFTDARNLHDELWQAEEDYTPPKGKAKTEEKDYDYWHSPDSFPLGT